jgi:hypothetical protein
MTEEAKQRMWDIDHKSQLGNDISKEDKDFFNAYYEIMLEELEDSFNHFKHHSGKFNCL